MKSTFLPLLLLGIALAIPGTAGAQTEPRKSTPLPAHLPLGVEACFGRVYDPQHLKQHARQRVTSFHIFRDFTPDLNWEMPADTREEMLEHDGSDGYVNVTAFVRFRDRKGVFSHMLSCRKMEDGKVFCGIECDGGSFNLRGSGSSLIVDNNGFVVVGGCGASDEEHERAEYVSPGADDKTFRLDKQPVAQCVALRDAQAPAWVKLGQPVRERFDKVRATCHARSYDETHLRAHPQQKVRRIAMLSPAREQSRENDPSYHLTIRVQTRDAPSSEMRAYCVPDRYNYICTPETGPNDAQEFYLTRAGDGIMVRDRRGVMAESLGATFGSDDRMFKLLPASEDACTF